MKNAGGTFMLVPGGGGVGNTAFQDLCSTCNKGVKKENKKITEIELLSRLILVLNSSRKICTRPEVCLNIDRVRDFVVDWKPGRFIRVASRFIPV